MYPHAGIQGQAIFLCCESGYARDGQAMTRTFI
jgi:hypothetical protein